MAVVEGELEEVRRNRLSCGAKRSICISLVSNRPLQIPRCARNDIASWLLHAFRGSAFGSVSGHAMSHLPSRGFLGRQSVSALLQRALQVDRPRPLALGALSGFEAGGE